VSFRRRVHRALSRREYPVVPAHIGRLDYEGAEVLVGVVSPSVIRSRLRPVAKEPWTVRWLEDSLRPGDVLYDVGANIGSYSLIAGKAGVEGVRVVAFEPAYGTYAALCDNVVLNCLEDVVMPLPVLLAERTGGVQLGYASVEPGSAEHELDGSGEPHEYRQTVLGFSLDDLVRQFDLPPPTLLKLDVDGAEPAVLAGAAGTLADPRLRSVLVEIDRRTGEGVTAMLEQAGLTVRERIDERDGVPLPAIWYGIFERAQPSY
jgi:FkbM family methyltransferase